MKGGGGNLKATNNEKCQQEQGPKEVDVLKNQCIALKGFTAKYWNWTNKKPQWNTDTRDSDRSRCGIIWLKRQDSDGDVSFY